jgi:hypothetical protein
MKKQKEPHSLYDYIMAMTIPERQQYFKKCCGKYPELLERNYITWNCHPLQEAGWPILPLPAQPSYHSAANEAMYKRESQNMENIVPHRPKSRYYNQE